MHMLTTSIHLLNYWPILVGSAGFIVWLAGLSMAIGRHVQSVREVTAVVEKLKTQTDKLASVFDRVDDHSGKLTTIELRCERRGLQLASQDTAIKSINDLMREMRDDIKTLLRRRDGE